MTEGGGEGEGMRKNEVSRSFSGWLSDIITAGPSLVVFSPVPFPHSPFYLASPVSFSFSLSLSLLPFFVDTKTPSLCPSYFVSRHCPFQFPRDCGANAARYRINFLSRGCRDFTLLERRHWGEPRYGWKPPRRLGEGGRLILRLGVEAGDEGEIKPRRKLKRGTEGS